MAPTGTECGLACLGMVAGYHGQRTDLAQLRRRFSISQHGATLGQLIGIAGTLGQRLNPLSKSKITYQQNIRFQKMDIYVVPVQITDPV